MTRRRCSHFHWQEGCLGEGAGGSRWCGFPAATMEVSCVVAQDRTGSCLIGSGGAEVDIWYVVFQGVLEGIRKGEIVSSGAVHNSAPKEGSMGRGMRQDSLGRGRGRGRVAGMVFVLSTLSRAGRVARRLGGSMAVIW